LRRVGQQGVGEEAESDEDHQKDDDAPEAALEAIDI
jgi:hypothetical protein